MSAPGAAAQATRTSRRLSREARRHQLVRSAMPLAARQGLSALSLESLALRAGVTRNLLYHYFPRGRSDVVAAVAREAADQLSAAWAPGASGPLSAAWAPGDVTPARRMLDRGISGMLDHALAPTHAWRVYRLARSSPEAAVAAAVSGLADTVISALAAAGLPGDPLDDRARLALKGYLSFQETVLDEARSATISRQEVMALLLESLDPLLTPAAGMRLD